MITSIKGNLASVTPLRAVIEIGGLGYEVNIPVTTAEKLPDPGSEVKLHTMVVYREDAQTLYGFSTVAERDFFRLMIEQVSGVGPKVALTIMSKLPLGSLQTAISAGDFATLSKCPGIGKKTAERLVVELKGKVGGTGFVVAPGAPGEPTANAAPSSPISDAVLALSALGYKPADADKAVRAAARALGATATTEALIKKALG